MQINSGQITPGPSLFQALQSGPKAEVRPQAQRPVGETEGRAAVQASDRSEAPSAGSGRDFPRGSLLDISA